jgi:hypothetical protein
VPSSIFIDSIADSGTSADEADQKGSQNSQFRRAFEASATRALT